MLRRLYFYSFFLFFILPAISIFVKICIASETKFVVVDTIVLGASSAVYGVSSMVVRKKRHKIKVINVESLPYILTTLVVAFFAIRLMPFGSDNLLLGYFENEWRSELSLLYAILSGIIALQSIVIFVVLRTRQSFVQTKNLLVLSKVVITTAIIDIVVVVVAILAKLVTDTQYAILDVIVVSSVLIFYVYYLVVVWLLNKLRLYKNIFGQIAVVVPIVFSLVWTIVLLLPIGFWENKFLYIALGAINVIVLSMYLTKIIKGDTQRGSSVW